MSGGDATQLNGQLADWAAASVDIFGVLVLAMLVQQALNVGETNECSLVAAERRVPDSRGLLAAVRVNGTTQRQTARQAAGALRRHPGEAQCRRSGAICEPQSVKTATSQAKSLEVTEAIHYSVRRFAAVTAGGYVGVRSELDPGAGTEAQRSAAGRGQVEGAAGRSVPGSVRDAWEVRRAGERRGRNESGLQCST